MLLVLVELRIRFRGIELLLLLLLSSTGGRSSVPTLTALPCTTSQCR
jgi:hypothetical protein